MALTNTPEVKEHRKLSDELDDCGIAYMEVDVLAANYLRRTARRDENGNPVRANREIFNMFYGVTHKMYQLTRNLQETKTIDKTLLKDVDKFVKEFDKAAR